MSLCFMHVVHSFSRFSFCFVFPGGEGNKGLLFQALISEKVAYFVSLLSCWGGGNIRGCKAFS